MVVACAYVHIHRNVNISAAMDGTMNARINYLLHNVLQILAGLAQVAAAKLHQGISRFAVTTPAVRIA